MIYEYTKLIGPFEPSNKYNVFGVVEDIIKAPRRVNGRMSMKFSIIDETVQHPFLVSIFCRTSDEVIPELTKGSVIRLHRMMVERFNNELDGRVFSPKDVAIVVKEKLPTLDWTTSAKKLDISDSDNIRAQELVAWSETLAGISVEEFDSCFNCGSSRIPVDLPSHSKAFSDNGTQTTLTVPSSNTSHRKRKKGSYFDCQVGQEQLLSEKSLDFAPCSADLEQANFKDLLVWKCTCGCLYRTSELKWSPGPGPQGSNNLGSAACRKCGAMGMTIPRFHFYLDVSEGEGGQPEIELISGELACEFLGFCYEVSPANDKQGYHVRLKYVSPSSASCLLPKSN